MQPERVIRASTFKERCLALLDQVAQTRVPILVTKRGKPVARVVPLPPESGSGSTLGSVRLIAKRDDDYFSTGETWDTEPED
jgi:prevent-host-death family protein